MSNQSSQGQSNDKRVAKKRLRESGSQTEDIIPNGGHCCEAASKLEEMNSNNNNNDLEVAHPRSGYSST